VVALDIFSEEGNGKMGAASLKKARTHASSSIPGTEAIDARHHRRAEGKAGASKNDAEWPALHSSKDTHEVKPTMRPEKTKGACRHNGSFASSR
jgi:hypothetical protein